MQCISTLFAVAWLQLPEPPMPRLHRLPLPTIMLAAGLVLGMLVAAISGWFARIGAGRRARRARHILHARVEQVAQDAVIQPVERELTAHDSLCKALGRMQA